MKSRTQDHRILTHLQLKLGSTRSDKTVKLEYEIFDRPITRKWIIELKRSLSVKDYPILNDGHFYGRCFYSPEFLLKEMDRFISIINHYIPNSIHLVPSLPFQRDFLNQLHADFERLDADPLYHCPPAPSQVKEAVLQLNYLVHRAELFLSEDCGDLIDIIFRITGRYPLEREDYSYFDADNCFGFLYLTYGTTGVPPLSAFLNGSKNPPIPQTTYTSGFFLSFKEDQRFTKLNELSEYLYSKFGIDATKPEIPIGYISLGRLNQPTLNSRHEVSTYLKDIDRVLEVKIVHDKVSHFRENLHDSEIDGIQRAIAKKIKLNQGIDVNESLYRAWQIQGLTTTLFPNTIRILILEADRKLPYEVREELAERITDASLFPISTERLPHDNLGEWLDANQMNSRIEVVFILEAGAYIGNAILFAFEMMRAAFQMKKNHVFLAHHTGGCPGFIQLNYSIWRKLKTSQINFSKTEWFSELLGFSTELGLKVEPVVAPLCDQVRFLDRNKIQDEQQEVRVRISEFLRLNEKKIYYLNNEPLEILSLPRFKPDHLVTVAAGLKPAAILNQYWPDRHPDRIDFTDYSDSALRYMKELSKTTSVKEIIALILRKMNEEGSVNAHSETYIGDLVRAQIRSNFDGQFCKLARSTQLLQQAKYQWLDFIANPKDLLQLIDPRKKTLVWHSNAWDSNPAYHRFGRKELDNNYLNLGRAIGAALKKKGLET